MSGFELFQKWEDEGLDTDEEALELAQWLVSSGLVNSRGEYGRFVQDVIDRLGGEDDG